MDAKLPAKAATGELPNYGTEPCAKFGLGVDYLPNKNVSIGVEVAYVRNFSNLENIAYTPITLGVSCYFEHFVEPTAIGAPFSPNFGSNSQSGIRP
jgi:hypothetical protein